MPVPSPDKLGRVAAGRAFGIKLFCQNRQMPNHYQSIPDWSRPGLPTTASGVAQQGICGNYATAKHSENKSRNRGGRRVGTLNIGTMTGRGREVADMMERRNVDILS